MCVCHKILISGVVKNWQVLLQYRVVDIAPLSNEFYSCLSDMELSAVKHGTLIGEVAHLDGAHGGGVDIDDARLGVDVYIDDACGIIQLVVGGVHLGACGILCSRLPQHVEPPLMAQVVYHRGRLYAIAFHYPLLVETSGKVDHIAAIIVVVVATTLKKREACHAAHTEQCTAQKANDG